MGNSNGKPVVLTDEVSLNHFRLLRVVGKGAFGKVRIVERKDTGLTFALKYIRKDEIVRSESVRNIIRERRMLEHLNHPFLCNLRYSFQDMEYLYIVVDLMNGGDLRFHINRKTFTEEAVRFWIAELGCALRYIHGQNVVHRDVKPDNVLLDSEGHVHLADFNVASDLHPSKPLSSKSGTLAYLAPEVYAGKGYGAEVDWWSLGVLFYECIYNKRPFEANHQDALASLIVRGEPPFPVTSPAVSMPCLHAISSLLEKNKHLRIGASGFETFTDNPFFRDIDFAALEEKDVEPVFCPSSEKTNFDATYDLEELLLEEAPLEARARKQKPRAELRGDATQQEIRADELHRMIETMFEPFNYTTVPDDRAPVPTDKPRSGKESPGPAFDGSHATSIPNSRSQTPAIVSGALSASHSPDGSPPLAVSALSGATAPSDPNSPLNYPVSATAEQSSDSLGLLSHPQRVQTGSSDPNSQTATSNPRPKTSHPPRPQHGPRGNMRSTSMGGGSQFCAVEPVSWTEVSAQATEATTPTDEQKKFDKPAGMLGFLRNKKGRDRSPKAKEKERGVLGKEGARVVVSGHFRRHDS